MTVPAESQSNWLIIGLGNPGSDYELTRHNIGFMVIDKLAQRLGIQVRRKECRALVGQKTGFGGKIELVKPQTFMNLSGEAVSCLLTDETRSIERTMVIVDDLAIPFGTMRVRRKGSDGGHNGLKSLKQCLHTEEYFRMRIGIRPDHPLSNAKKFVLERFPKSVHSELAEIIDTAADAVECVIEDGIDRAMSRYNN